MEILNPTRIKVFGVGGGGSNAVNRMYLEGTEGVELFVVNTDVQHLASLAVPNKIQIGEKVTKGLGAGAKPEIGEQAALEDVDKIREILRNTDMLFIACGLGGGTGTGAAPVIAETAKDMGILTVAVVTKPFCFIDHICIGVAIFYLYPFCLLYVYLHKVCYVFGYIRTTHRKTASY